MSSRAVAAADFSFLERFVIDVQCNVKSVTSVPFRYLPCTLSAPFYYAQQVAAVMQNVQIFIVTTREDMLLMYRTRLLEWIQYLSQEKMFDNCSIIVRIFRYTKTMPDALVLLRQYGIDVDKFEGKMRKS